MSLNCFIEIQTERFFLRSLREADVTETYLRWFNDQVIKKYIVWSKNEATRLSLKRYVREKFENGNVLFLGIFTKEENLHIGNIKYEPIHFEDRCAIMGILVGNEKWRSRGVAREAILASAKWLNEKYDIKQIVLGVEKDNVPAVRAYEKIGFKKVSSHRVIPRISGEIMVFDV